MKRAAVQVELAQVAEWEWLAKRARKRAKKELAKLRGSLASGYPTEGHGLLPPAYCQQGLTRAAPVPDQLHFE